MPGTAVPRVTGHTAVLPLLRMVRYWRRGTACAWGGNMGGGGCLGTLRAWAGLGWAGPGRAGLGLPRGRAGGRSGQGAGRPVAAPGRLGVHEVAGTAPTQWRPRSGSAMAPLGTVRNGVLAVPAWYIVHYCTSGAPAPDLGVGSLAGTVAWPLLPLPFP